MMTSRDDLTTKLAGTAGPGTGPDLTGYTTLTYAPGQWGEGVRVASSGCRVAEIAEAVADGGLLDSLREVAGRFELSLPELFDAIRYAADHS